MDNSTPIFVFGCYRSGTTLMAMVLDAHSKIHIAKESHYITRVAPRYLKKDLNDTKILKKFMLEVSFYLIRHGWKHIPDVNAIKDNLDYIDLPNLIKFLALYGYPDEYIYWGDNTPSYIEAIPFLDKLFPKAKYIFLVRDPRDIIDSSLVVGIGARNVNSIINDWILRISCGIAAQEIYGNKKIFQIKYEDFVTDTEKTMHALCDFLNVQFEESMFKFFERPECIEILTEHKHHSGLKNKINSSQIGKHKNSLHLLEINKINTQLEVFLKIFNYEYNINEYSFTEYYGRYKDYAKNYLERQIDQLKGKIKKNCKG